MGRQILIIVIASVVMSQIAVFTTSIYLHRALAHEMVHAYMFKMGEDTAQHGPSFQAVLARLAMEGAFEGLPSSPEERAALRNWIDQEKARLATEDAALRQSIERALVGFAF